MARGPRSDPPRGRLLGSLPRIGSLAAEVDTYVFGFSLEEPREASDHGLYSDAALL
jgi:hypothetical protein